MLASYADLRPSLRSGGRSAIATTYVSPQPRHRLVTAQDICKMCRRGRRRVCGSSPKNQPGLGLSGIASAAL
jgi:hypothetical protein